MQVELYPPGGGQSVMAHKGQVENMKRNGWTEKPAKVKPSKEDK